MLVIMILAAGPHSPHKTLDKFVKSMMNFSPNDGEKWRTNEPNVGEFNMTRVKQWNFERLSM
jgi:hypothetical protein